MNLRALPPLVVVEVLAGLQTRLRAGLRPTDVALRAVGDTLRRQQAASVCECDPAWRRATRPVRAARLHPRRPPRPGRPGSEQAKDTWDLAVFGHPAPCRSPGITQPWLAAAAKRWAIEQLPRHRGSGAGRVRQRSTAPARLSSTCTPAPITACDPAALGRSDLESFLNRLAYLEANGQVSRYRRNMICRDVRAVLAGIRALGLTRPGQPGGRAAR